ncbi:glycosyltransferase [Mucilaginibacter sp.]|uniref:glycosyltransferase n=1 Tax=Mucilaginibacter sp. TaxID=1882438 RepID=UPI00283DF807|nr:glycosyltransferase [Mucilaginibacter sp.]MDR3694228.1 glycosyltransferase [Mucilaginibacter sp.]
MDKPRQVLLIAFPTFSHYVSMVPLAKKYQSMGYKVSFTGTKAHKDLIEGWGMNFIACSYLQNYDISSFRIAVTLFVNSWLSPKFMKKRFRHYLQFSNEIAAIAAGDGIEKIVLDAHLSFYCLFFLEQLPYTIIFNTKLYTAKNNGFPPLNANFIASRNLIGIVGANILWYLKYIRPFTHKLLNKIVLKGYDEHQFIKRSLAKKQIEYNDFFLPAYKAFFHYELNMEKVPFQHYITRTNCIEYPWKKPGIKELYLDMPPYVNLQDISSYPNLNKFIEDFLELKKQNHSVVLIYCALGTMTSRYKKKCIQFYKVFLKTFDNPAKYRLILSTGDVPMHIFKTQNNAFIRKRIPQHSVLKLSNLMINHGGLNTIMECINFKVPMLVYPVNPNFDQKGNAARVVFHGIGLRGSLEKDNCDQLLKKANKAMSLRDNIRIHEWANNNKIDGIRIFNK